MKISKHQLYKIVNQYLNEEKKPVEQSYPEELDRLVKVFSENSASRHEIVDAAYDAGILEGEAISIIDSLEYYLNSGKNAPTDKKNLEIAKDLIRYMCRIYDVPEDRKYQIMSAWENFGRHIVNPASPFVAVTLPFGIIGVSFYMFLAFEAAWVTNRDLYYKLAEFDKHLMHILTLGATSNFAESFLSLCKQNADKLILYSTQMYIKPTSPLKKSFTHKNVVYNLDGKESSITEAKNNLKSVIYDISFESAKKTIIKTAKDVLSQDPGALHKKERESIEKSGGTTAAKFNVLDNL
jgi:hypothetical protein|tara:strand:- start:4526 stop:5410 length:885 start_codon:yes stop_codon:yes gene_type:complete